MVHAQVKIKNIEIVLQLTEDEARTLVNICDLALVPMNCTDGERSVARNVQTALNSALKETEQYI